MHEELGDLRPEFEALRRNQQGMAGELLRRIQAAEERLAENSRLRFRQLADLYRATLEKIDALERHVGGRIDATRGAIEALRSSLERQDLRSDELARRITALETRPDPERS